MAAPLLAVSAPPAEDRLGNAMLLAEQRHRTMNILQMVLGVLSQAANGSPAEAGAALVRAEAQVTAFALLEAALNEQDDGAAVGTCCSVFLGRLCSYLDAACLAPRGIEMRFSGPTRLDLDPRACRHLGLAVIEAVLNAAKHAFSDEGGGELVVDVRHGMTQVLVSVADDGRGITSSPVRPGRGRDLVERLIERVGGSGSTSPRAVGTCVELAVPRLSWLGGCRP